MRKSGKWILLGAVVFIIGMLIVTNIGQDKEVVSEEVNESTSEESTISNGKGVYEDAKALVIEKVIRTQTEQTDGTIETRYDSYLLSEINLEEGTDYTEDYSDASVGEGIVLDKVRVTAFQEEFGIDYRGKNGLEIFEEILEMEGIDGNLDAAVYDQETYEMTGQNIYVLEEPCEATNYLLQDIEYDNLIQEEVSYQARTNEDGIVVPEFFNAMVQYEVDGQVVTRNLYLQISVVSEEGLYGEER